MSFRKIIISFGVILMGVLLIANIGQALRATRPPILTYPLTEGQVSQLNRFNEEMWNIQYGRYETDIVSESKDNAKNGELWFLETGVTTRIQIKANDVIFTFTPDGY